jgi:Zinc knuckle
MYQSILASQQLALGAQCTAEDLIQAMEVVYRQNGGGNHGGRNNNNNNNHELAMAAPGNRTKTCWNCGKNGHVSKDCRAPRTNNKYKPGNNNNNNGSSNTRSQRDVVCDECGMRGHKRDRCFCLAVNAHQHPANWRPPAGYRGSGSSGAGDEQGQVSLDHSGDDCNGYELMMCQLTFAQHKDLLHDPNIWLGDSGASSHSTAYQHGMVNMTDASSSDGIVVGNNQVNAVEAIGDIPGVFYNKFGEASVSATLTDVSYSRDNAFNLLSIPQLLMKGWTLSGKGDIVTVTSPDGIEINFDIIIPTKRGWVYATYFKRVNELAAVRADGTKTVVPPQKLSINEAHAKFGHCSEALARRTAKALGVQLKDGPFKPCVACGMGKAKQCNVPKSVESSNPAVGERIHADISTIRKKVDSKYYVRPHWFMMVDAASGIMFSSFWKAKNDFVETACQVLHRWIERGIVIKKI